MLLNDLERPITLVEKNLKTTFQDVNNTLMYLLLKQE